MSFESRTFIAVSVALAALLTAGCGSLKEKQQQAPQGPTKLEIFEAVAASSAPDDDGDGLPNDVERRFQAQLGTDYTRADSDGDGLGDGFEIFGTSWLYLHSRGQAGTLAGKEAARAAADPTIDHTADLVDSDGDGVPDYLEYAGYRYEWREASFVLDPAGFRTDPLQWSTDQDAYGDGMEVSGINMDVAVKAPGNHPLVPAYPDIVLELKGYSVTLNEQITDGTGGSLEKGQSWSRETTNEHSSGWDRGVNVGAQYNFGTGQSTGWTVSAGITASWNDTDTSSVAVSTGSSITEQVNWNKARSYSSTDAARVKLLVRVHNRGTAPASNLVPTINLRIAGTNAATFEPPAPIYMLLPGATYPADAGGTIVIDRDALGNPLSLTDWELRALQQGGPLTLAVTQKRADVMQLRGGAWERVGDVNEYLARIVAVSAGVFLDVGVLPDAGGQARLARRLVYAGQGPTAPRVSLSDALRWTDGFEGAAGAYALDYQQDDGTTTAVPLTGTDQNDRTWRISVDPVTMDSNWPYGAAPASIEEVFALALRPGSQVAVRAPRPREEALPIIYNAYVVPTEHGHQVVACASDYDAIANVFFVDKSGREIAMTNDGRGAFFYSTSLAGYVFHDPEISSTTTTELVKVVSTRTSGDPAKPLTVVRPLEVIYTPTAQPPIIRRITYDAGQERFYARIDPASAVQGDQVEWVRLFHPDLKEGALAGYRELQRTIFAFEDPNGWEVTGVPYRPGMRLVAYSASGKYVAKEVDEISMSNLAPYASGTFTVDTDQSLWWPIAEDEFIIPLVDVDVPGAPAVMLRKFRSNSWMTSDPGPTLWDWWVSRAGGSPDLYVRPTDVRPDWDGNGHVLGFFVGGDAPAVPSGTVLHDYYSNLDYLTVAGLSSQFSWGAHGGGTTEASRSLRQKISGVPDAQTNRVFVFKTSEGRLAKAYASSFTRIAGGHYSFDFEYTVFNNPSDTSPPTGMTYPLADRLYAVGSPILPTTNAPKFAPGSSLPTEYRLCPAATYCWVSDATLLPAGLSFNTRTGVIYGTPTAPFSRTELRVFGANLSGETSVAIWIEVLTPPSGLSYAPATCFTGYPCTLVPSVSGDVDGFTIFPFPTLPTGLTFDQRSGTISGTPTAETGSLLYLVTASNRAGSFTTTWLSLATPLGAPSAIEYPLDPYTLTSGTPLGFDPSYVPTYRGGPATWTVDPTLLQLDLAIDPQTGALYGMPLFATTQIQSYTVRAQNASGSSTTTLRIQVNP